VFPGRISDQLILFTSDITIDLLNALTYSFLSLLQTMGGSMSSWLVRGWIVSMLLLLGIATASAQYCTNGSACNPSSLNNIVFVDGVTNTTLAAAKAALLAISPSGGVIDMRGVHTGSALSLGTFDPGNGVQITLLLGPYAYTANQITLRTGFAVIGPGATISSSNASNAPLIVIPQIAGQPAQHVYLQGLHLAGFSGNTSQDAVFADCSNATGNGLFYSNFDDINIQGFKGVGLHLRCRANDYSSVNQFNVFRNVQVFRVSGGAEALVIEGAAAQMTFIGGQFDGQAEGDGTNIYIGEYNTGSANPDNIQFIGTTTQSDSQMAGRKIEKLIFMIPTSRPWVFTPAQVMH
jgi:hypothetical protein